MYIIALPVFCNWFLSGFRVRLHGTAGTMSGVVEDEV